MRRLRGRRHHCFGNLCDRSNEPIATLRDGLEQPGLLCIVAERLTQFGDRARQCRLADRLGAPDIVEQARERFDLVLVDTPPLLSTDDPRTLATMAKGILLVVSAGATNSSVNEAILAVEALNAPLMGIVGNRFKESGTPYYY